MAFLVGVTMPGVAKTPPPGAPDDLARPARSRAIGAMAALSRRRISLPLVRVEGAAFDAGGGARTARSESGAMRETLTGVPEGLAPLVLARLAEEERGSAPPLLLHVARDDRRLEALAEGLAFFAPKVRVIQVPAWDTVPYDRIGPNAEIVATRIARSPASRPPRARARPSSWC